MNQIRNRDGSRCAADTAQTQALSCLYNTLPGRAALSVLTRPAVSRLGGLLLDSRASAALIPRFVARYHINLDECEHADYPSYNAFFTRKLTAAARPVNPAPEVLISPCDAKLRVYPITEKSLFSIKQSQYRTEDLLGCATLAQRFAGGQCLIFRLTVDDYHRYCYLDDGRQGGTRLLGGELHTVNPIALDHCNIYKRNCRAVSLLHTAHFGDVAQIEVGAMFVGKIINHHSHCCFRRGDEKGRFAFGGSTIALLLQAGRAQLDSDILRNSQNGDETVVRFGSRIGLVEKNR